MACFADTQSARRGERVEDEHLAGKGKGATKGRTRMHSNAKPFPPTRQ